MEQTAHLQTALLHQLIGVDPDTNRSVGRHSDLVATNKGIINIPCPFLSLKP